jgi:hypothetical protein
LISRIFPLLETKKTLGSSWTVFSSSSVFGTLETAFFTFFTSNVPQSNAVIFDAGDVDRDGDNGNYFEDMTRIVMT